MSETPIFTTDHAEFLTRFLGAAARPEGTMGYEEVAGFLFALSSVPTFIPPTEWLPMVFRDSDAAFADQQESDAFISNLLALQDRIIEDIQDDLSELPPGCAPQAEPLANFGPEAPLGRWSRGFIAGHRWMGEWWPENLEADHAEDLSAILIILAFFSSRDFADSYMQAMGNDGRTLEQLATHVLEMFHEAMRSYAELAQMVTLVNNDDAGEPLPRG